MMSLANTNENNRKVQVSEKHYKFWKADTDTEQKGGYCRYRYYRYISNMKN